MLVRDENAIQFFRRAANAQETFPDLPPTQSGIDEHARLARLHKRAVPARATPENGELDGHARRLGQAQSASKLFVNFRTSRVLRRTTSSNPHETTTRSAAGRRRRSK